MVVASREGGNRCRLASVSLVNGGKKPRFSACVKVDMAGENKAAWANATRSAVVLVWRLIASAASRVMPFGVCQVPLASWMMLGGSVHNPLSCRGHVILLPSGVSIVHCVLSKVTLHP